MSVYEEYQEGLLTPVQALRALVSDLAETESELAPLQEQRESLRAQISEVLARVDGEQYTIKGYGTLKLTNPSVTQKYDTHLIDMLVNQLAEDGYEEIARQIAACKGKSMRAGGLRIEKEK